MLYSVDAMCLQKVPQKLQGASYVSQIMNVNTYL